MADPKLPGNEVAALAFRDALKGAVAAVKTAQEAREAIGPDGLSDISDDLDDEVEDLMSELDDVVMVLLTGADSVDND